MTDAFLPEYIDGLPNVSGSENIISQAMARSGPRYLPAHKGNPSARFLIRSRRFALIGKFSLRWPLRT